MKTEDAFSAFADAHDASPEAQAERPQPKPAKPSWREALRPIDVKSFAGRQPPPREWLLGDWLQVGKPAFFAGKGGAGKTRLLLQLALCRAAGQPFLGIETAPGSSVLVLAEDDKDEAERQIAEITTALGIDVGNLKHAVTLLCREGQECRILERVARSGALAETALVGTLREMVGDLKPELVGFDHARHLFEVGDGANVEIHQAWRTLSGITAPTRSTPLLLGHVAKAAGSEFAGGAAWENGARSRWFLGPAKGTTDDDEPAATGDPRRVLRRSKSNASGTAELALIFEGGAFSLEHPEAATFGDKLTRDLRHREARQAFMDGLDRLTNSGINVSHSTNAKNYAPKEMIAKGYVEGFTKTELEKVLAELLREGVIVANSKVGKGSDRHPVHGLTRAAG